VQMFYDQLMENTDTGAAVGDAVATFDNVAVIAPRGRFDVEMYLTFFKLVGQVWLPVRYMPNSRCVLMLNLRSNHREFLRC
jgi:hypothetical protein